MSLDDLFEILDCFVEIPNYLNPYTTNSTPYITNYNGDLCTTTATGNIK